MKKIFLYPFVVFVITCSFSHKQEQNLLNNSCSTPEKVKQDTIRVEFGNKFLLYWDCVNHKIIEDENYFAILKNKNNIRSMAYFIANQEVVCDFVCSKETALKKGDVAYLFLNRNRFIYTFECLRMQFDWFDDCWYPVALLDYIENNRDLVFQKVMICLDSKDIPR